MTCLECRFYEAGVGFYYPTRDADGNAVHVKLGDCRRRAPTTADPLRGGLWPSTRPNDWCAEFEAKPNG
jgi:hypothetical protein